MAEARIEGARIRGLVTVHGPICRRLEDEHELYGGNAAQMERLRKTVGLDVRYVVDEQTTTLDLCSQAAQRVLDQSGTRASELDGLVFVTQTPDHFQPCNAALLHGRLGAAKTCASFDVNLGCSGYVYGLWLSMMLASNGLKRMLLLAGDTMSRCVNPKDRSVAALFGDAGSATLIESDSEASPAWFDLRTDGSGAQHIVMPGGGFRERGPDAWAHEESDATGNVRRRCDLKMDGGEVFGFSMKEPPESIRSVMQQAGVSVEAIDAMVFHQANKYIVKSLAKRLKMLQDKVPSDLTERYGNLSSASIPAMICDRFSQELMKKEMTIVLAGFGVGLSWASGLVSLGNIFCCEMMAYAGRD